MKTICTLRIEINHESEYPYNVQLWYSYDGGSEYLYTGEGRFFKDHAEACEYFNKMRSPYREFPLITKDRQRLYESIAEVNWTPAICGFKGRACRQMCKEEGANRFLCDGCRLAAFCHAADLLEYAKED